MQEFSDNELLRQYAEGHSETAFETLVTRHVNLVYSAALRKTGNFHAAQEIAQAVFIILAKKAGALRQRTVLSGWLYQAARLTAASFLRNQIRRVRREQEASMEPFSAGPEPWPQLAPLLEEAMGRLNEKERNAVVLRFFEGKSFQEVGTALGGSENAAKKRVAYALEKLRHFFAKRGVNSTTAIIAGAISVNSVQAAPAGLAQTISATALAKGAVPSVSTTTLVKGALKIMAWTKAKTAIVAGAAALLAIGTGTAVVSAIATARTTAALATMQGNWEGTVDVGPARLRLVLKIFETNGVYRATLDSIDQGAKDIPVPKLSARAHSLRAQVPALDVDYRATLNSDGVAMTGRFKQLNRSFLLILKRTAAPDTVAALSP
jgi:RNA polymerase sigma factor (sigma-70 family)